MMSQTRTIGVVTGGGDCPGLNAAIRAIVRVGKLEHGWRIMGVADGFDGLLHPEMCRELTIESVRGILPRGGTILGSTNSLDPFAYPVKDAGTTSTKDCSPQCFDGLRQLGIEALIVIGGNGTLTIAHRLSQMGMKLVGVPKTIDNDLQLTDVTLGFDSALHVAMDAIDRLHTTAESHHRVIVVEVMGRDAGWIALDGGVAGGADVILLPEIPFTIDNVCAAIRRREAAGRRSSIIVVAEGVKLPERDASGKSMAKQPGEHVADALARAIRECSGKEVRAMVLGHMQRGGSPSPFDRILATRFGAAAAELVSKDAYGQMVSLRGGKVGSVPLAGAISPVRLVNPASETLRAARAVGISFGDRA